MIKSYKLFTFPSCGKCEVVKEYLSTLDFPGEEFDLKTPEGVAAIRGYFLKIKDKVERTPDGSLPAPIVILFDENDEVVDVCAKAQQVKDAIEK